MRYYTKLTFWTEAYGEGELDGDPQLAELIAGTLDEAGSYMDGISEGTFLVDSSIRKVAAVFPKIIAEALARMSDVFWEAHSQLPREEIMSWRNFFQGDCVAVEPERLWKLFRFYMPLFREQIAGIS